MEEGGAEMQPLRLRFHWQQKKNKDDAEQTEASTDGSFRTI